MVNMDVSTSSIATVDTVDVSRSNISKTMNINGSHQKLPSQTNAALFERELFLGDAGKYEHLRITKNVVLIGIAFMLHFTAFHGTANLQSSINAEGALGSYTLAAIYGSLILSNIFLPAAVIRVLGCKWTIALSFISYMPFILAQFYPQIYTLIPAGLAVGLGGGPLWCAKCTYLTVVAEALCTLKGNNTKSDATVVRFFGLFFIFYQMAQVWGNLISSSVLSHGGADITHLNTSSEDVVQRVASFCGAAFCPSSDVGAKTNLTSPPDHEKIQILSGIFLALMISACLLVALFVDPLKRYEMGRKGSGFGLSGIKLLAVTLKQLLKFKQILLLPITMFIGAEQAFIAADFTSAFVSCGWGIPRVGYVMIAFGIANSVAAGFAGVVSKLIGRNKLLAFSFVVHGALMIWMRQWTAIANDSIAYCSMAAIWGLVDGIWLVIINSFYGILFVGNEEAAFSNFRLFEATGSVITYMLSPMFCTQTKLIVLVVLMSVGMLGYGIVEFLSRKENRREDSGNKTKYGKATVDTQM